MKKIQIILLCLSVIGISQNIFGQAKKPTIMVLPSDNWCEQRYFMSEFDNQGTKQKVPNYKQAFQEDTELGQVITKLNSLLIRKAFEPKVAEQELKSIEAKTAEDNMTKSVASGAQIYESQLDKLRKRVKMDIIIQLWWKVNKDKSVSFTLEAFDAYTNKSIAAQTFNAPPSDDVMPVKLEKAISNSFDPFLGDLQNHFNDMLINGREILITLKRWDNWDKNFETEINGEELTDYINKWMNENTVSKRFNRTEATENLIIFEQVRIPIYDKNNNPMDAREFAKGLQKYLKASPFNYEVKLMQRGLGEAVLVLGEK
ncbi:MAG: DUF6175 family protein [Bacteroidia bacterium]|nr:DUF6175 family protein [Bacteroidia bacterium]